MSLDAAVRARFEDEGTVFDLDLDLSVADGETLVVLGPSGSGKSLLLECLAGFHDHDGHVTLHGRDVTDESPERRGLGFVFQDYALFPHLNARENVAFGLRYHETARDPDALLEALGVGHLADRRPETLSGGEKQRVALARSLAIDPDALLLDEPLSALDAPTRQTLRTDLADAIADVTSVYVTHDRTTARALADRVAVVHDGRFVQVGAPEEVFESPASAFVARFTGANCLPASALSSLPGLGAGDQLAIRPEHVAIDPPDPDVTGRVERVVREDAAYRVSIALGVDEGTAAGDEHGEGAVDPPATVDAFTADPPAAGDKVGVGFPAAHVTRLRVDGDRGGGSADGDPPQSGGVEADGGFWA